MCFTLHPMALARSTRSECVVAAKASPTTYTRVMSGVEIVGGHRRGQGKVIMKSRRERGKVVVNNCTEQESVTAAAAALAHICDRERLKDARAPPHRHQCKSR